MLEVKECYGGIWIFFYVFKPVYGTEHASKIGRILRSV